MHFLENSRLVAICGVLAALIAIWGLSRTLAQAREASRAQQWWTSYVWFSEHATTTEAGRR